MSNFRYRLLNNWDLIRMLRLGIGVALLITGIQNRDWMIGAFSLFFVYQAITGTGCCGTATCGPARRANRQFDTNAKETFVEFEEIK